MKTYGFEILAFWDATEPSASADADEAAQPVFMYLLQWPDEQTMKSAWEGFMADQEWKDIKTATAAEHGKFVDSITDQLLTQTDYSPGLLPK